MGDQINLVRQLNFIEYIQKFYANCYVPNTEPNGGPLGMAITLRWRYIPTRAEHNGKVLFESANAPNILVNNPRERNYLYFMTTEPLPKNAMEIYWYYGMNQTGAEQDYPRKRIYAMARPEVLVNWKKTQVTFHYVWDRAYRKQKNLTVRDEIKGRNDGKLIYGNGAIAEIPDLKPLTTTYVSTSTFEDYERVTADGKPGTQSRDWKATLVSPTGEMPEWNQVAYYETDLESGNLLKGKWGYPLVKRPTYAKLAARLTEDDDNIYVNIANDLDWPEGVAKTGPHAYELDAKNPAQNSEYRGNHIIAPALDEAGNLVLMKHYYLTYRQLPSTVTVTKTDDSATPTAGGKPVEGAEFALYRVPEDANAEPQLIADNLKTDANGQIQFGTPKTKEELIELVKNLDWLGSYDDLDVYKKSNDPKDIYLTPGQYLLKETKAPEGYIQPEGSAAEHSFRVTKPTFDETSKLSVNQTLEVSNEHNLPSPVTVIKLDEANQQKLLENAVFTLYKGKPDGGEQQMIAENLKTDKEGRLLLGKELTKQEYLDLLQKPEAKDAETKGYFLDGGVPYLFPGDYYLVETAAPKGYKLSTDPVPFTVARASFDTTSGKAIAMEVKVTNKAKSKPPKPDYPVNPSNPNPPVVPSYSHPNHPTPDQPDVKKDQVPKTGESMSMIPVAVAYILIASALVVLRQKRRQHR